MKPCRRWSTCRSKDASCPAAPSRSLTPFALTANEGCFSSAPKSSSAPVPCASTSTASSRRWERADFRGFSAAFAGRRSCTSQLRAVRSYRQRLAQAARLPALPLALGQLPRRRVAQVGESRGAAWCQPCCGTRALRSWSWRVALGLSCASRGQEEQTGGTAVAWPAGVGYSRGIHGREASTDKTLLCLNPEPEIPGSPGRGQRWVQRGLWPAVSPLCHWHSEGGTLITGLTSVGTTRPLWARRQRRV